MQSYTRNDLLALTSEQYLANGYTGPDGAMRPEFNSDYATAASTQFLESGLSPQELSLTAEAVRQILPLHEGSPGERARATADEALGLVANAIKQPNNEVLARWLNACAAAVHSEADLQAFLAHLLATERLYGLVADLSQQDSSPPESSPADVPA